VAAAQLRHLRQLDAALCSGVDDAALSRLSACPSLAEVNVRACWQVSDAGGCGGRPAFPSRCALALGSVRRPRRRGAMLRLLPPPPLPAGARPRPPPSNAVPAGVHALLSGSTSVVSLTVEGCYRLFGCQGAVPDGFDPQHDPRRPGVLSRRPPAAAPLGAAACAATARDG
jgi:hypothetical protein